MIRVLEEHDTVGLAAYCETMHAMGSGYADISAEVLQSLFSRYWRVRLYLADLSDGQMACGIKGDRARPDKAHVIHLGIRTASGAQVLDEAVEALRDIARDYAATYPDVRDFFGYANWLDGPGADLLFDKLAETPWITVEPRAGIRACYSATVEAIADVLPSP